MAAKRERKKERTRRRYGHRPIRHMVPTGSYAPLVTKEFAEYIGLIMVNWSHLEEEMIVIFSLLLGDREKKICRPLYRSVFGAHGRLKAMWALLENSEINQNKDDNYDYILTEFEKVTEKRNMFAHALWHAKLTPKSIMRLHLRHRT